MMRKNFLAMLFASVAVPLMGQAQGIENDVAQPKPIAIPMEEFLDANPEGIVVIAKPSFTFMDADDYIKQDKGFGFVVDAEQALNFFPDVRYNAEICTPIYVMQAFDDGRINDYKSAIAYLADVDNRPIFSNLPNSARNMFFNYIMFADREGEITQEDYNAMGILHKVHMLDPDFEAWYLDKLMTAHENIMADEFIQEALSGGWHDMSEAERMSVLTSVVEIMTMEFDVPTPIMHMVEYTNEPQTLGKYHHPTDIDSNSYISFSRLAYGDHAKLLFPEKYKDIQLTKTTALSAIATAVHESIHAVTGYLSSHENLVQNGADYSSGFTEQLGIFAMNSRLYFTAYAQDGATPEQADYQYGLYLDQPVESIAFLSESVFDIDGPDKMLGDYNYAVGSIEERKEFHADLRDSNLASLCLSEANFKIQHAPRSGPIVVSAGAGSPATPPL